MTTFYIIGKNLKLRLGIHLRVIGKQYVITFLVSHSALGIGAYQYPSIKGTCRHIIKYPLKQLVAGAIRKCMVNIYKIINMLPFISQEQSVRIAFCSFNSQ